ncbi:MAG: hypothetical protein SGBAC_005334 [Bacillariaceae sp.]
MKKPCGDFPRVSTSGTLLFGLSLGVAIASFSWSSYGHALWSGKLTSNSWMQGWIFVTSLLNVASHAAVVLGALQDTYVISILLGVGFDVLTRFFQLWWWMQLIAVQSSAAVKTSETKMDSSAIGSSSQLLLYFSLDNCFHGLLSLLFLYQMWIHVRALLLVNSNNLDRMQTVLKGALNNLRGIPGEGGKDHLFAYSDLTLHLLPCLLSGILLQQQEQLHFVVLKIAMTAGTVAMIAPSQKTGNDKSDDAKKEAESMQVPKLTIVCFPGKDSRSTRIGCSCNACSHRVERMMKETSFVCNPIDGLCALWMHSFEEVSMALDQALRISS